MRNNTIKTKHYVLGAAIALVFSGCGQGHEPEMDPASVSLAGKADTADIKVSKAGGGYERVTLYGAPAKDLWDVMEKAGGFRSHRGTLNYLVGTYAICASNGSAAACHIYGKDVRTEGDYEVALHGRRFASAPSELFGAVARAAGLDPSKTTAAKSASMVCEKDSKNVWCGIGQSAPATTTLRVSFQGLPKLGKDYVYEGWFITSTGPVSAGRFTEPTRFSLDVDAAVAADATLYVLTIEPAQGDDPAPSDTHVVAGAFAHGWATLNTTHAAAIGSDFRAAKGGFILETPSSAATDDYDQGIWFLDPSAGPGASLDLPTLPAGWAYEGWVVVDGKPVSTGRFTQTVGADADGAGSTAGPGNTPPFPGQDFIDPAVVLTGGKAVISVEPDPDDSPAPFALKPLVGDIKAAGPGALQDLGNMAANTAITGVARLDDGSHGEYAIVANRGEGTFAIIDSTSRRLLAKVSLPAGGESMYVTYDKKHGRVFVGDRANDQVLAYDADDFSLVGAIASGKGVFHMWDSPDDSTLWVVNDIDKTLAKIHQKTLELRATLPIPRDLAAAGGKPHDVIVDPYGHAVYSTIVGLSGKSVVVKLSARTGRELARANVGGDAHLSVSSHRELLYVPSQDAGTVHILRRYDLREIGRLSLPGAHGVAISPSGNTLYVTNLPSGGKMALYTVDLERGEIQGAPLSVASDGKPHNLAISADGDTLLLTHSGPNASRVSIFSLTNGQPVHQRNLDSGTNPFGVVTFTR